VAEPEPRPDPVLWYYLPGAKIVKASECKGAEAATAVYFSREHDTLWKPIAWLREDGTERRKP
jgi:hypothetical protein